jgi:hypothetical protein
MVKFPGAAFAAAPKMTVALAPATTVNEPAGFEVTPAGSAASVTRTGPEKPFAGVTDTLTAELAAPSVTESELGETEMEKSGTGRGG